MSHDLVQEQIAEMVHQFVLERSYLSATSSQLIIAICQWHSVEVTFTRLLLLLSRRR